MEGDDGGDGLQEVEGGGGVDDLVGDVGDVEVALGGDGDDLAVAALDFLHVGHGFFVGGVAGGQADGGEVFVDHGDEAVFHLAGGAAFGVDV